ncbi:MAG: ADYC domain-containing protein [Minicystis sp.]
MHAFGRLSAGATIALSVCSGCAPSDEPTREAASAETVANGLHLNGLHLNGLHLNGLHLNGLHLNGLHLNGLHLNGVDLNNARLVRGTLRAALPDGKLIGGGELSGTEISATATDGTPVTVRIDAVSMGPSPDVMLYAASYQAEGMQTFEPLCGADEDGPVQAIPLPGTWDESEGTPTGGSHVEDIGTFTFACQGYALAKCVELGYAPWRTAVECRSPTECHALPLALYHQACTRMLRGDYCGDGMATTRDGTLVDVWDNVSLQSDAAPTWAFEAEWTQSGAACVMATRWPTILDEGEVVSTYIQEHCPERWQTAGCGESTSTFFTSNGYTLSPAQRPLIRTRIDNGTM